MSLQIIGIASDIAGGKLGSASGVNVICEYLTEHRLIELKDNNYLIPDFNNKDNSLSAYPAKYIDLLYEFFANKVAISTYNVIINNDFPFIVSGDHSSALACVQGIQNGFSHLNNNDAIGIIWIDAHADIHTPFSTFSGNLHGMPLAAIIGHKEKNKNTLNAIQSTYWDKICNISKMKVNPKHIAYCGVRSLEHAEQEVIDNKGILALSIDNIRHNMQSCVDKIHDRFNNIQKIYISVDIDVLDCEEFKSTGCNEKNGLTMKELTDLVLHILESFNDRIIAFEISEFNPKLEISRKEDTESIKNFLHKCVIHLKKHVAKAKNY